MLTKEFIDGQWVTVDDQFRGYSDPASSSSDWWNLMNTPRYAPVLESGSFEDAARAVKASGYATDPNYVDKLSGIGPKTPEQRQFWEARFNELQAAGAPAHLAQLGATQSALETGWGKSAPNNNFYGIKGPGGNQVTPEQQQQLMMMQQQQPQQAPGSVYGDVQPVQDFMAPQDPLAGAGPFAAPERASGMARWMEGGLSSPLAQAGFAMLASPGNYGDWAGTLGRGGMVGQNAIAQQNMADQELFELQMKREEAMAKRGARKMTEEARQSIMQLPEPYRTMALMNPEKAVEYLAAAQGVKPKQPLKDVRAWRGDVQKEVAPLRAAAQAAEQLETLINKPGPFSDVATVYNLVKSLDPTSVVREGEVALMNSAAPLFDRLTTGIKKIKSGGAIGEATRQNIKETMAELVKLYGREADRTFGYWNDFAARNGIDARDLGVGGPSSLKFPTFGQARNLPPGVSQSDVEAEMRELAAQMKGGQGQ